MAKKIVEMVPTNLQHVLQDSVGLGCSNVKMEIVHQPLRYATESTIVVIIPMRNSATHLVPSWSSSVVRTVAVFKTVGSATAILIVKMVPTKLKISAIIVLATTIQNLRAKMVDAFPNCGCVISTTIVEMIPMNPRICVDNAIVPPVGRGAPEDRTTVASQNGFSVTEKTIVGMAPTSYLKIVRNATQILNLNVPTTDVFLSNGCVIFQMIAVTVPTKRKHFVRDTIDRNVLNRNSVATTENAFRHAGDAIKTMIVTTTATKLVVLVINVKMERSNVPQAIA